ncbi:uncharacterized protein TRIREDRAFT_76098 [Trichoderma reesei QM6a]|uniref:Predicted protein n=2 Tax=Hypocrea jecorina TaxID=51453 RepID=G0RDK4_HYPJQ|nr:uncharacterized protein TRIREDRAFT_76098 [Trichoderma reesei QM6a]EGR50964.1 predicted protein [Trichoderma reesei QM6a]ETS05740.1 hypothetical protein M419DRAFT_23851 [Trichoderma reesei RUT C-30]
MASAGAIWGPVALRLLRAAVSRTTAVVRDKLASAAKPLQNPALQPVAVPVRSGRQAINPAALAAQQQRGARGFSSTSAKRASKAVRRLLSSESAAPRLDRSRLPSSNTSRQVAQFSGRAPFASALRPNLTGGAMPRTAGGYSLGGGARYFSHTPAAPAQVVQNVSQAMRAFFLSGQRIRYDGVGPRGEAQYRAVSVVEDEAMRKLAAMPKFAPGAYVDFQLSPTITAMSPLAAAIVQASGTSGFQGQTVVPSLNTEGFLDVLSADFGRALKDLTAIYADLERLSALGDLPISLESGNLLRVRFPGVDVETVERLCDDIGVQRGIVSQDVGFESATGAKMALRFPFAPDSAKALTSPGGSERSLEGHELDDISSLGDESFVHEAFAYENSENPWMSETDGYESMSPPVESEQQCSDEYEGLEGIYRFLEECDKAKGRLG